MCVQLLGLDFLLDTEGTPWLLEVNGTPSLAVDHTDGPVRTHILYGMRLHGGHFSAMICALFYHETHCNCA